MREVPYGGVRVHERMHVETSCNVERKRSINKE
jgi:hypothetical protein